MTNLPVLNTQSGSLRVDLTTSSLYLQFAYDSFSTKLLPSGGLTNPSPYPSVTGFVLAGVVRSPVLGFDSNR